MGVHRLVREPDTDVRHDGRPYLGGPRHRSRLAQNRLLRNASADDTAAGLVADYSQMASEWTQWASQFPEYALPVEVGLQRCPPGRVLEVCCGTGQATDVLRRSRSVVALDASVAMLARLPRAPGVHPVTADVRRLPFADDSFDVLVGLNAVVDLGEAGRVLKPEGGLLWCSTFGNDTPLYLSPHSLLRRLGASWTVRWGRAGYGDWALARRLS